METPHLSLPHEMSSTPAHTHLNTKPLYLATNGKVISFDISKAGAKPTEIWRNELPGAGYYVTYVFSAGPVVYVGCGYYVFKLKAADGTAIWRLKLSSAAYRCTFQFLSATQLVVGASGYVILVDVETGKQLWEVNLKGTGYGTVSLCCFNGQIFAGSNGTAWGITADTGSVLWSNNLSGRGYGGTTILAGSNSNGTVVLYVGQNGYVTMIDAISQREIKHVNLHGHTSVALHLFAGNLYVTNNSEMLMLDSSTLAVKWRNKLEGTGNHLAAALHRTLIGDTSVFLVGNNGYVVAVEAFTGARLWSVSLPGSGYRIVTMLDIGGVIYAASNGMFYGLDRQTGKVLWTEGLAGMSYMSTCLSVDGMITDSNSEQPFVQEEEAVAAQRSAAH